MPKPLLEDMIKRKARPVASRKRADKPAGITSRDFYDNPPKTAIARRSRYMLWTVAVFSAGILLIALSFLWGRARVDVYPKVAAVELNENFSAVKTGQSGSLIFDVVVISGEESQTVEAATEKEVSTRAEGKVVIFNSFSSAPQKLAIDTRLSGSNGKLYKTKVPITVPGQKPDGTPGSVEVGIYAAEPGEAYNSSPLDFNILGFQGTPKYDKFKVRSKPGTEINGGFIGKAKVADDADKEKVVSELRTALEDKLFKKAIGQIPEGFILFKDAAAFTVDKIDMPLGDDELEATVHGTLYGLLFEEKELTKLIAGKKLPNFDGSDIYIPEIRELKFTLGNPAGASLEDMSSITFSLAGPAQIVWKLDADKFKDSLLGQSKNNFNSTLAQYKNIERAELSLSPVWRRAIPAERSKVEIVAHYPESE